MTDILEKLTHDELEFYRRYSLNTLEELIAGKPELEEIILSVIVNKLGDKSKKIQCHVIYLLIKLTKSHIEMAEVVIREVSMFISRPTSKTSHIYYAVAFLNRMASMVAPKDAKIQTSLFKIYFGLFNQMI